MSHGDRVTRLPPGFASSGVAPNAPFAVIADEKRRYLRPEFHPEVVHTPDGAKLIRNFVRKIAGLTGDWTMRAFREEAIEKIRAQVGKGRVICGLSGGVDSAVAAVLIHEAIGDQLTCVFVDHGLLRLDEAETVVDSVSRITTTSRWCMLMRRSNSSASSKASPTRKKSARPSAGCSSTCSTPRPRRSAAPSFWRRARSIPT